MPEPWLDQMFEPCGVYRAIREDGVIVDFDRVFLNAAGRRTLRAMNGDESVTRMRLSAPNIVEQGLFARYVEVAETGAPWTGVCQAYEDDRRSVMLDIQAWRVPDGIAITYRDVSERERLVRQLEESEQRFRATVEQLPDAVSVFESVREAGQIVDFRWIYANEDNAAMTGYSVEQLVGSRLLEVFPEQRAAGMIDVYTTVVETGESWQQPTVWYEDTWGDGSRRRRAFDVRASQVGDGFVVVSRDVTELRQSNAELAGRNQTLQDLIGVMGHDVGNPASAARGFVELARDALEKGRLEDASALLNRGLATGRRVEQLLANVLAMAQSDLDVLHARPELVDVAAVVGGALVDLGGELPVVVDVPGGMKAWADPSQLRQVVANLVTNAFRHGRPPVSIIGATEHDRAILRVEDHGSGVAEEFRGQLFERLARADVTRDGAGLGLYLARLMCRSVGGDLHHEPGAGGTGTSFVVSLAGSGPTGSGGAQAEAAR